MAYTVDDLKKELLKIYGPSEFEGDGCGQSFEQLAASCKAEKSTKTNPFPQAKMVTMLSKTIEALDASVVWSYAATKYGATGKLDEAKFQLKLLVGNPFEMCDQIAKLAKIVIDMICVLHAHNADLMNDAAAGKIVEPKVSAPSSFPWKPVLISVGTTLLIGLVLFGGRKGE